MNPVQVLDECKERIERGFEYQSDQDELVALLRELANWFENEEYLKP